MTRDEVDSTNDNNLATFVLNSHIKSHPLAYEEETWDQIVESLLEDENKSLDTIPQDMLQKYIFYARWCIHPKLQDVDREKITSFYSDIRKFSSAIGGIPIGVRHIESMIRMSEAHAKMHLRQYVKPEDINVGIRMLLESFLSS